MMRYDERCRILLDGIRSRGHATILAIETSCDETAAAIVVDGRIIRSNIVATQIPSHARFGGVVPEIASRAHVESINVVIDKALADAGLTLQDVDAVAVTNGPGLVGALLIGVTTAKALAFASGKPIVAVNHITSHISAAYLTYPDLEPPFLCLTVSGGHTAIVEVISYGKTRTLGATLDDAAGEAFDKAARVLGLPYPGGPMLDQLAQRGDPTALTLPRAKTTGEYDFSFSGLKTAFIQMQRSGKFSGIATQDAAASYREAIVDALVSKTISAAIATGQETIVLAGGVAANLRLRGQMEEKATKHAIRLCVPAISLCTDNAAMVGSAGFYEIISCNAASDLTMSVEQC